MLSIITPLILTFNEEPNIQRTLAKLSWAQRVVVVDSFSTDRTEEICLTFPNVTFIKRTFDSHSQQWNFGLEKAASADWILALDADYVLSDQLVVELTTLEPPGHITGYIAKFQYAVNGVLLKGSVYPPVTVLFKRSQARYLQDGHTQRLSLLGEAKYLENVIVHDDRKSLSRWLSSQSKYMRLEAKKLCSTPLFSLSVKNILRRTTYLTPILMFSYCAFIKGNVFGGRAGLYYSWQRTLAEIVLVLEIMEYWRSFGDPNRASC